MLIPAAIALGLWIAVLVVPWAAGLGREHLEANRERLSVMFNKLKHVARKMDWMRQAWSGEPRAAAEEDASGWIDEFVHARQEIRHALLQRTEASPAEQRRIAAILRRATAEITGKSCD